MTGAEMRCLREYLGLSTQWMATRMGVGPRAVLRWESPGQHVPQRAETMILALLDNANTSVAMIVKARCGVKVPAEMAWHSGDYPPQWHRAIAARAWQKLGNGTISYIG